jgi:hypothetical protein
MTVLTSVPFGVRAAQNGCDGCPGRNVIDVHRREAALVVMRVPERKLLAAMRRTERVVDVEDLNPAGLHRRAELIEHGLAEPSRVGLAWRILQPGDGRLRCQRRPGLRTPPDRDLHQRIVPQPVKVDRILISAHDRGHALTISNIA